MSPSKTQDRTLAILGDVHIHLPKNKDSIEYREDVKRYEKLKESLIESNCDYVIFAGDLFDKARPSLEEIQYVTEFVKDLHKANTKLEVIIIDGNHEAVTKGTSTYDYIQIPYTKYIPLGKLKINQTDIQFFGYKHLKDYLYTPKADILISHFRCNVGVIKEEVPLNKIAPRYKDVILGDIHMMYNPLPNVWYTSSPYGLHYTASPQKHGYIKLTVKPQGYSIDRIELNLPQKLKLSLTPSEYTELLSTELEHRYVIEVTGTLQELKDLPKHELVRLIPKLKSITVQLENINTSSTTPGTVGSRDVVSQLKDVLAEALPRDKLGIIDEIYREVK